MRTKIIIIGAVVLTFVAFEYFKLHKKKTPATTQARLVSVYQAPFWSVIESSKASSHSYEEQCKVLEQLLIEKNFDIVQFDKDFRKVMNDAYTYKLWGAAYLINGGCSDDCFYDFRAWLVSQGEEFYKSVIKDPDILADAKIPQEDYWAGLQFAADNAYFKKSGKHIPVITDASATQPSGQKWEEEELPALLPKLAKKYAGQMDE